MRRLTDEELSRVLSQHATGRLTFACSDTNACFAVAAMAHDFAYWEDSADQKRAWALSEAFGRIINRCGGILDYFDPLPITPERLLVELAKEGLA